MGTNSKAKAIKAGTTSKKNCEQSKTFTVLKYEK
jgi:hypothetical protein